MAIKLALRATLKFIPWVGMAASAAASFAYTFATGMAWNWYFTEIRAGHVPTEHELREVFKDQLAAAAQIWKTGEDYDHEGTGSAPSWWVVIDPDDFTIGN